MHIVITGATSAIGEALALEYAATGVSLCLQGRNADALNSISLACQHKGALVDPVELDLLDDDRLKSWLDRIKLAKQIDLLIVNAGMNIHVDETHPLEDPGQSADLMKLNLLGAMQLVQACLPGMLIRGTGQIALISSLAAWHGLPQTPSYSASKAGLKAYGESLRLCLRDSGIRVNVVLPGYVSSPMCDAMPGPKPWVRSPEYAASVIRRGLEFDRGRISFPWPLSLGCQILSVLPEPVAGWILKKLGYG